MKGKISLAGDLGSGKSTVSKIIIDRLGAEYYYLYRAMPELFKPDLMFNALH